MATDLNSLVLTNDLYFGESAIIVVCDDLFDVDIEVRLRLIAPGFNGLGEVLSGLQAWLQKSLTSIGLEWIHAVTIERNSEIVVDINDARILGDRSLGHILRMAHTFISLVAVEHFRKAYALSPGQLLVPMRFDMSGTAMSTVLPPGIALRTSKRAVVRAGMDAMLQKHLYPEDTPEGHAFLWTAIEMALLDHGIVRMVDLYGQNIQVTFHTGNGRPFPFEVNEIQQRILEVLGRHAIAPDPSRTLVFVSATPAADLDDGGDYGDRHDEY